MLNLFRSQTTYVIVGSVVILVFALEFRAGRGSPTARLKTDCAVEYAGNCLDQKDFFAAYGLAAQGLEPKAARQLGMRQRILDGLAERELLATEAERLGLAVSDDRLERELAAGHARVPLPAESAEMLSVNLRLCRRDPMGYGCEPDTPLGVRQIQVANTPGDPFDYKVYEKSIRIIANRGPKEFRAAQDRELLAESLRQLVRERVRVSDNEAYAVYDRERSSAIVRTVVLTRDWFAKFAIDTSDAAVDKWAAANASQVDEAYKADKDQFTAGCPVVSEIAVSLPDNASDSEKADARAKLEALRDRIKKGESFEAVAREASSAPSAALGGKVGCLNASHGLGSEPLVEAAGKLAPGALSDVIETPQELYLLRLDGKLDAATLEHAAREQVARNLYVHFAAEQSMRAFAADLVQKAKGGAKLEEVTRALTDELARRGVPAAPAKPGAAPNAKEPATPAGLLAADRPRFEVSTSFNMSGNPVPDVEPSESLAARAFALSAPDAVDEQPVTTRTGLVVMQLKEKTPVSREQFEKEKWPIVRHLEQRKADAALTRYVADLRKAAGSKLKIDERFAQESKAESAED
ncbi:MAG TPA: peptidylprolyl isomerase [Polyangiaceae bacterium]|nr:peptidylprolyl isomerase [Polyangiaceae bacterium]